MTAQPAVPASPKTPDSGESCGLVQFYLASASPRRSRLLSDVGLRFEVLLTHLDETKRAFESCEDYVLRMAEEKAVRGLDLIRQRRLTLLPVLAADTGVVIDADVLGKPKDADHAKTMLQRLSGRVHTVLTAVAVCHEGRTQCALSRTDVTFKQLSEREIEAYWESGEPLDKAGAYAIQGAGGAFIAQIKGSYTGVVGLPMYETHKLLQSVGIDWL